LGVFLERLGKENGSLGNLMYFGHLVKVLVHLVYFSKKSLATLAREAEVLVGLNEKKPCCEFFLPTSRLGHRSSSSRSLCLQSPLSCLAASVTRIVGGKGTKMFPTG
jgi:hypothetical protein